MNPSLIKASAALAVFAALALAAAVAVAAPHHQRSSGAPVGVLKQPGGHKGCVVNRSSRSPRCAKARALHGPGPFLGSEAVAISPDGRNVYVASSRSNAITIFAHRKGTGKLSQSKGENGCIAERGAHGCARGRGLIGPNSVAVSPDGRSVYATSVGSNAVTAFRRDPKSGALRQVGAAGGGCIAEAASPGCVAGNALDGADVVVVSPDGENVYVGAFFGNAVASFARNASSGGLTQLAGDKRLPDQCFDLRLRPGDRAQGPRGDGDQRRRRERLRGDRCQQRRADARPRSG